MEKEMRVTFPGGKRVNAEYKGFTIKTDQSVYQGGEGSEPAPFDLFLASIATCAGIYVLVFCQNRGIAVDKASLMMRTFRNPDTKMIDKITIDIHLPPEFPDKYAKAVIKSINGCAVKAHMEAPPQFEVRTVFQGAQEC
jgi:ribosomal protein S12 methylthiotransferase accessory factor